MSWLALMLAAFFAGSIPFGVLIARAHRVDIRWHGSGNIGATNVWRVLGRGPGLLCFGLDVLKGLAPTLAAGWWHGLLAASLRPPEIAAGVALLWLGVMALSILGHMFSPWVGFKGGKGVATGLGGLVGVWPYLTIPALAAAVVWALVAWRWRYVGLASCAAAAALPAAVAVYLALWSPGATWAPFTAVALALAAVVIARHRGNLRRTLAGTESRIGQRVNPAAGAPSAPAAPPGPPPEAGSIFPG